MALFRLVVAALLLGWTAITSGQPEWQLTGSLVTARTGHTATLLLSGEVLIVGGSYDDGLRHFLASAELYDPVSGTFTQTAGSLRTARVGHTATLLPSGQVLIVGGCGDGNNCITSAALTSAELYDPTSSTFSPTGSLASGRGGHTATLLPSGRVLVAGGSDGWAAYSSAELYDAELGGFVSSPGAMAVARANHTATLLASGKVLLAAGCDSSALCPMAAAEVYDPQSGSFWSTAGSLGHSRQSHSATLLATQEVLVAGALGGYGSTAELFDPSLELFSPTGGPMVIGRGAHTATLLPSGRVLFAAGEGDFGLLESAELYDPVTGFFVPVSGSMAITRAHHTATLLPAGKVLIAGGVSRQDGGTLVDLAMAELFDPSVSDPCSTDSDCAAVPGFACSGSGQCSADNCVAAFGLPCDDGGVPLWDAGSGPTDGAAPPPDAEPGPEEDSGTSLVDAGGGLPSNGCSCNAEGRPSRWPALALVALVVVWPRRRRHMAEAARACMSGSGRAKAEPNDSK